MMIRDDDGQEESRFQRLASALVQHPYTRSALVRRGLISATLAVFWLLAGFIRLSSGGRVLAGFVILGALFFAVRTAAHAIVFMSSPLDEDASTGSGIIDDN